MSESDPSGDWSHDCQCMIPDAATLRADTRLESARRKLLRGAKLLREALDEVKDAEPVWLLLVVYAALPAVWALCW